jgi:hypothetical protein
MQWHLHCHLTGAAQVEDLQVDKPQTMGATESAILAAKPTKELRPAVLLA